MVFNNDVDVEQIVGVLSSRSAFYDMLASLYFNPLSQEQVDALSKADYSAYGEMGELVASGARDMAEYFKWVHSGTRQELAVDFTGAFGGMKTYDGKTAMPCKSVFTSEDGLMYQEGHHEVFAAFKEARIKKRDDLFYPDDHLAFMCEFEALLARRAAEAVRSGAFSDAEADVKTSLGFLRAHVLSWFDDFVGIAEKLLETKFYQGLLKMTKGYFILDEEVLEGLLDELGERQMAV